MAESRLLVERADYLRADTRALPSDADFTRVDELRDVEAMTAGLFARVAPYLTVRGTGQINLNSAPLTVLSSLPGLGTEAITLILRAQASTRPLRSLDELTSQAFIRRATGDNRCRYRTYAARNVWNTRCRRGIRRMAGRKPSAYEGRGALCQGW